MIESNRKNNNTPSCEVKEDNQTLLNEYIVQLKARYAEKPAATFVQVRKENKGIPFSKLREWIKEVHGLTAVQYLTSEGIILDAANAPSDEEQLADLMIELKKKYETSPASTLVQIKKENRNLPISKMDAWTRNVVGLTAKEYLVKEGIILDLKADLTLTNESFIFQNNEKDYMISNLSLDFCYIDDVKRIFIERFENSNINKINAANMNLCGYLYCTNYIVKKCYSSAEAYFESILIQKDLFDIREFDSRLQYDVPFRQAVNNLCSRYEYLEYDNWKYISLERCKKVIPDISKDKISEFIDDVLSYFSEVEYLTIKYIQNRGYNSIFFNLGFSDWLCASLLRYSGRVGFFKVMDSFVFYQDRDSKKDRFDFLISFVLPVGSVEMDDLVDLFYNDYGIVFRRDRIIECVKGSSMYYDRTMDKVYYKKDYYYDEL